MVNLVEVSHSHFRMVELAETEQFVLDLLRFDINLPTREYFASRLLLAVDMTEKELCLYHFLLELSLLVSVTDTMGIINNNQSLFSIFGCRPVQDYNFCYFPMSKVAAGVLHLTRQVRCDAMMDHLFVFVFVLIVYVIT